jgi:hypothetical protein
MGVEINIITKMITLTVLHRYTVNNHLNTALMIDTILIILKVVIDKGSIFQAIKEMDPTNLPIL